MRQSSAALLLMMVAAPSTMALAQEPARVAVAGTQLDIVATGEVTRVPDIARINAGVVTQAATATEAIRLNAAQMERVLAALKRAGIAERDVQTSSINLNPEYRYQENQPPVLTGYRASNDVSIRFRDIKETGAVLDALVAQGANQINGPMLEIDKPEAALDEARQEAIRIARARADVYARSLGMRVTRIAAISEAGAAPPRPMPVMAMRDASAAPEMKIMPGEQSLAVTLSVTFELQ
jgi:uncharacterized protein